MAGAERFCHFWMGLRAYVIYSNGIAR